MKGTRIREFSKSGVLSSFNESHEKLVENSMQSNVTGAKLKPLQIEVRNLKNVSNMRISQNASVNMSNYMSRTQMPNHHLDFTYPSTGRNSQQNRKPVNQNEFRTQIGFQFQAPPTKLKLYSTPAANQKLQTKSIREILSPLSLRVKMIHSQAVSPNASLASHNPSA